MYNKIRALYSRNRVLFNINVIIVHALSLYVHPGTVRHYFKENDHYFFRTSLCKTTVNRDII